jgi:hypothetical protein
MGATTHRASPPHQEQDEADDEQRHPDDPEQLDADQEADQQEYQAENDHFLTSLPTGLVPGW